MQGPATPVAEAARERAVARIEPDAAAREATGAGRAEGQDGRPAGSAAGLLRRARRRLRGLAPGARAVKTALAVGIAWWLATLLGEERPLFAALGAFVGMEATVAGSLRRTALQVAGMTGGVLLAFVVGRLVGTNALAIGGAVLLGLWLGRRVGSPDRVGVELGVTTVVLVVFAAGDPDIAVTRIWETVLGGVVAATINAFLWPPDYLGQVADDLDRLVTATTRGLRESTRVFVEQAGHEGAAETLERLRTARASVPDLQERVDLAGSALRLSPLRRGRGPTLDRYRDAVRLYGRAVDHTTTLARTVAEHAEREHTWEHTDLAGPEHLVVAAETVSLALERYEAYARAGDAAMLKDVRRELARARAALARFLTVAEQERGRETAVQRLVDIAAVASELDHLVADLDAALAGATEAAPGDRPPSPPGRGSG